MHVLFLLAIFRTAEFIEVQGDCADEELTSRGQSICSDASALKEALDHWYASYAQPDNKPITHTMAEENDSMLLSRVFFAAISIYLSGIFDYEITHWHRIGLIPPTLDEETVQIHTNAILQHSTLALDTTNLSPLLFLFPLRIAGARSRTRWQREWVKKLVTRIGGGFAVATVILTDLIYVWEMFGLEEPPNKSEEFEMIHEI